MNPNWQIDDTEINLISLSNSKNYNLVGFKIRNSSLILVGIFNKITNTYEHAYVQDYSKNVDGLEIMNQYYIDGAKRISVTAKDNRVIEFRKINDRFPTIKGRTQLAGSFDRCMDIAVNACSSDWQCAILCGLAFWQCAAETAIACYATK